MPWRRVKRLTLRQGLLVLLVPTMVGVSAVELVNTYRYSAEAANTAFDRSLLGVIKAIDANVSTATGGLAVELPYRLFELFELTASGSVHFRVATADGLAALDGHLAGAQPQVEPSPGQSHEYRGLCERRGHGSAGADLDAVAQALLGRETDGVFGFARLGNLRKLGLRDPQAKRVTADPEFHRHWLFEKGRILAAGPIGGSRHGTGAARHPPNVAGQSACHVFVI